ncbi:MAG: hypothetical protein JW855_02645 [Gammaproteobacteria bacterium]|nr:hypothetical protein [Gammaproteobacteria bacterium]
METKTISLYDFTKLINQSKTLEKCNFGEKILITPDEKMIKIFYRKKKRLFTFPYSGAKKFIKKTWRLHKKKIDTIIPEAIYHCPENKCDLVIYPVIQGISVRNLVYQGNKKILKELAAFLAYLHKKNIYFRKGHLGTFMLHSNGRFALIDVANTRFLITLKRRAKSIAFLLTHRDDVEIIKKYGYEKFITHYLDAAKLSPKREKLFRHYLNNFLEPRG